MMPGCSLQQSVPKKLALRLCKAQEALHDQDEFGQSKEYDVDFSAPGKRNLMSIHVFLHKASVHSDRPFSRYGSTLTLTSRFFRRAHMREGERRAEGEHVVAWDRAWLLTTTCDRAFLPFTRADRSVVKAVHEER